MWNIPLLPVNHMEGHIASVLLAQQVTTFPLLSLLISGGHTELLVSNAWGDYNKIGQTLDDAVGEAYDKVARMIDLPYPGGPEISKLAEQARTNAIEVSSAISLPRPMLHSKDYNFSFSGLKTAVLYLVKDLKEKSETQVITALQKQQLALEFETAVTDVLVKKVTNAITEYGIQSVIVGGGVIANTHIRNTLQETAQKEGVKLYVPEQALSTDNAVMIAMAGYLEQFRNTPTVNPNIVARGNLSLDLKKQ
jgi:N6-L-threonylcarbamoyladenine synthase